MEEQENRVVDGWNGPYRPISSNTNTERGEDIMIRLPFRERVRRARLRQHRHRVRTTITVLWAGLIFYMIMLLHVLVGAVR